MKPILFNTAMVNAILQGRKTQTRRPMKHGAWGVGRCPYKAGDVLYIREAWNMFSNVGDCGIACENGCQHGKYVHKAHGQWDSETRWQAASKMPKDAARVFLEVVQVDRQWFDWITDAEAKREGYANRANFLAEYPKQHRTQSGWMWVITFKIKIKTNE